MTWLSILSAVLSSPEAQKNADEECHRRAEREQWMAQNRIGAVQNRYAYRSLIIGMVTCLGAVVAAGFAGCAYLEAKKQAVSANDQVIEARKQTGFAKDAVAQYKAQTGIAHDALIAANRPWLKFTTVQVKSMEIQTDQVFIWVSFGYKNIGHSPANVIHIAPSLLITGIEPWSFKEVRKLCSDTKKAKRMIGDAIFPDEDGDYGIVGFGRPMNDLIKAHDHNLHEFVDLWTQGFGAKEGLSSVPLGMHNANFTTFTIIACLNYRFEGSDEIHVTSFVADIKRSHLKRTGSEQTDMFDFTVPEKIDGKDIKMTTVMLGKIAD